MLSCYQKIACLLDTNVVVYYLHVGRVTVIGLGDWKIRSQIIHIQGFSALLLYLLYFRSSFVCGFGIFHLEVCLV